MALRAWAASAARADFVAGSWNQGTGTGLAVPGIAPRPDDEAVRQPRN